MSEIECKFVREKSSDDVVKAQNREDFMKRWFAIALSVGFATALSRMPWIEDERIFLFSAKLDWSQINQIMRLFAAGVATLLSWEGYLLSIKSKPLLDGARFYIDVFLVTLYLILLLTLVSSQFWIGIHTLTFLIYIVWDFLSIKVHPDKYILANKEKYTSRRKIYAGVIRGSADIYHGPIVSYGLKPLVKTSGTDSLYAIWANPKKETVSDGADANMLDDYVSFCVQSINLVLSTIRRNLPKERWTTDPKVAGRALSTTYVNSFLITIRLLVEKNVTLSEDQLANAFEGIDAFNFGDYHSSQYARMAEKIVEKHFKSL